MTITYPCRHELSEDCPACSEYEIVRLETEIEKLRVQLGNALTALKEISQLYAGAHGYRAVEIAKAALSDDDDCRRDACTRRLADIGN